MLVNRAIIERIVKYADLKSDDIVLEIGCGTGNLTETLLRKCKVIGIEKDLKFVKLLKEKFKDEIESKRFTLIYEDALRIEFPSFTKLVSNIPYEISSPLIFKLFNYDFRLAVLMLQREFAERLISEDNRLGVISKAYCTAELLEIVDKDNFRPMPKVDSAVVRIKPSPAIRVRNRKLFELFITFAFSMKRKKLSKIVNEFEKRFGYKLELDREIAEKRPEEIGALNFARIVDDLRTR
ncbi:MAG: 16S rRNA (adenine(1518)-N(6)/adenine(1519)-N(6))-dimethyltransferase RsmA [Archaeoglobaceae archaeon]|nr:16S rRNA (adenine(1518)-N(6)/adenine(1519)-N(6))-dimethyltransferase RsmA [Archaeoglobales archaeon]